MGVGESERTQTRAPPQQGHQARLLPPLLATSCPDTGRQSPVQQGTVDGRSGRVQSRQVDFFTSQSESIVRWSKKCRCVGVVVSVWRCMPMSTSFPGPSGAALAMHPSSRVAFA